MPPQAKRTRLGIATGAAPRAARPPNADSPARAALPRIRGSGGRAILVGRGASDNDRLTLDHARPHDLWLHARDEAGAHVVVPLEREEACPPDLLRDAAMLAAHFSQARGQARVDVIYTPRRYVRKPRKSAAGSVQLAARKGVSRCGSSRSAAAALGSSRAKLLAARRAAAPAAESAL